MTDTNRILNRELSWLEFNQRVLDEAIDPTNPLLERLKFLAITCSNLDEFFMVRVGGLLMLSKSGSRKTDPSGLTPGEQLQEISRRVGQMVADQYECFLEDLQPKLAAEGIRHVGADSLSERQFRVAEHFFENEIFTVLSPMVIDSFQDFPLLINMTLNVLVRLENEPAEDAEETPWRIAIIPLGRLENRFITLPADDHHEYLLYEDAVKMFIDRFFPGQNVLECVPFRITRNADLSVREDQASDLLQEMEEILDSRKQSDCVRLEISDRATQETLEWLQQALSVKSDHCYTSAGPLDLSAFMRIAGLPGFETLQDESWPPKPSPQVDLSASMFANLSQGNILLCHPYESFEPVVRLIEQAAEDSDVLAIKQILYRTSRKSPIIAALKRAAQNDKHVTVIVELKARFDEERNIEWAKSLEQAGVQVIYGLKGLKTHAKVCIIIRRETYGIQRYVHFGTGNYNEITSRLYTDVSFMTADEDFGADASTFFNTITGYSYPQQFRKITAAPVGLREKLLELIEGEIEWKKQGENAHIMVKLNSLVDTEIIEALYAASQAGVKIELIVRGVCCLRPGVKGLSENIAVVSIIDRFLEHSRILYFRHGGDPRVFISSADWMPRNLDRRVELLIPIEDPDASARLIDILRTCLKDNVKGRQLFSDGRYVLRNPDGERDAVRSQEWLYIQAWDADRPSERAIFEPYRAPSSQS